MVRELIERFCLIPHPEGGYYREVYRSEQNVRKELGTALWSAVTTIYFLLEQGQFSRFHMISNDEIWHFYGGAPLELYVYNAIDDKLEIKTLDSSHLIQVVPGNCWQAARPLGEYTLSGCTVAPGFDFRDFQFMHDEKLIMKLKEKHPELEFLV